jgi:hypothetical protein
MKLYHYSARHHFAGGPGHAGPGIWHVGILPNRHPAIHAGRIVWLTDDPEWHQEWSPRPVPLFDCDRTEVRCAVVIPKAHRDSLLSFEQWSRITDPSVLPDLIAFGDPSRWFTFRGRIPLGWLRDAEARPSVGRG